MVEFPPLDRDLRLLPELVAKIGQAINPSRVNESAALEYPRSFLHGAATAGELAEMIERPEQQHGIERRTIDPRQIRGREPAHARNLSLQASASQARQRGVQKPLRNIDQMNAAAPRCQVLGVVADANADFGHTRARRDPPVDHPLRHSELDRAKFGQSDGFKLEGGTSVMARDLFALVQAFLSALERALE